MKLTQEADYALRIICRLAGESAAGDTPVGAATLSESVAVPMRFGLKILHKLAEAGIVRATRGNGGGYNLAESPETLTLRRVIEAIDGPITLNRCIADDHTCTNNPYKNACRLHHVFETLNAALIERLDRLTVAMVADDKTDLVTLLAVLE